MKLEIRVDVRIPIWYIYNIKCDIYHIGGCVMKNKYGYIGFVSLLGLWGLYANEPLFLSFFAFVIFFGYFWITPDEMFIDTLKKCATIAFFTNITITVISTFVLSYFKLSSNPLAGGAALGFGISIAIFVLLSFFFDLKERSGAKE